VPEVVGGWLFAGGPAVADDCTTSVGFEFMLAVPSPFVAITRDLIVWPTSLPLSTYELRVSPAIVSQLTPFVPPPDLSQRSQRYWNVIGVEPLHVPLVVLSVCPWTFGPETTGSDVPFGAVCALAELPTGTSNAAASTSPKIMCRGI
jgi:hypothetical protein